MNQKTALEILKLGHNVFLTGPAGSGKTYLLNQYIHYLKDHALIVAVTASTGIAATHLNGKTIHSWSGLGIKEFINEKDLKKISRKSPLKKRIITAKTLIIDEISMLSANQLDAVDKICRHIRKTWLPFGGIQTIFCGDFFQLPPVQRTTEPLKLFAYEAQIWRTMNLKICYLEEQHRQKDNQLLKILNAIRQNSATEKIKKLVASQKNKSFPKNIRPTKLFTHNVDVDQINAWELSQLPGKVFAYHMQTSGQALLSDFLKKSCLAPEKLLLKKGAQVMFVKNNFEEGYVNGTLGKIVEFDSETRTPIVETLQGEIIAVKPTTWMIEEEDEIIASIRQFPLRLAWAITVHKSQGMSLDTAEVDLGKSFEYGMGYVALSRVRTLAGLNVLSINEMAFQVQSTVLEKDQIFLEISKETEEEIHRLDSQEKILRQKIFAGNKKAEKETSPSEKTEKKYSPEKIRQTIKKAYLPWTQEDDQLLRKTFLEKKSLSELAEIFQRKTGAIRSRLKKLELL